jgi:hypothetical protein
VDIRGFDMSQPIPETPTPKTPVANIGNLYQDIMTSLGDFLGVIVGLGIITIGIVILIFSNKNVQSATRKVAGAAAEINPALAGAAIAANVVTKKAPRQENVTQALRNSRKKAAKLPPPKTRIFKDTGMPKTVTPAAPAPIRTFKQESTGNFSLPPTSPRAERDFD